mmetsp:Transcript_42424/g.96010  ORF Transcript_42424/g.96010 Transcript_42424/m.96010 type:complete len:94 (+) Transcript_42424:185-466(+)
MLRGSLRTGFSHFLVFLAFSIFTTIAGESFSYSYSYKPAKRGVKAILQKAWDEAPIGVLMSGVAVGVTAFYAIEESSDDRNETPAYSFSYTIQ